MAVAEDAMVIAGVFPVVDPSVALHIMLLICKYTICEHCPLDTPPWSRESIDFVMNDGFLGFSASHCVLPRD